MPDRHFADPGLVAIYDDVEGDRDDLDHYRSIISELGARSVLDVGCGTGTLACHLAADGLDVTGVDPAEASLDIARTKPGADRVRWMVGDAATLPPVGVDVVVMTGNVAQVFVTDESWSDALVGIARALAPTGHLVFETRDPDRRAWERWTEQDSFRSLDIDGVGRVDVWHQETDVRLPLVSFQTTYRFVDRGEELTSTSTLRFRDADEIRSTLSHAGFEVLEIRDAPDRPSLEFVFIARRQPVS